MNIKNSSQVSVIMNGHNAARYLKEAIESVLNQTYSEWEIIFWDNCSTDETAEIVNLYKDSRIKYFYSDEFMSLALARNCALEKAQGEFIAFLDCDDIWLPNKLEKQLPLFANKEVGLVYSDAIYFNHVKEVGLFTLCKPYSGWCTTNLLTQYCIAMQTVIIRKIVLDRLEYWFDSRFSAIEDYDFFVRISEQWQLNYIDKPLCKWRVHADSFTWTYPRKFIEERKLMLLKLKEKGSFTEDILQQVERANQLQEAKLYWKEGRGKEARNILLKLQKKSLKEVVICLFSFLPYKFIDFIYCKCKGDIRPIQSNISFT